MQRCRGCAPPLAQLLLSCQCGGHLTSWGWCPAAATAAGHLLAASAAAALHTSAATHAASSSRPPRAASRSADALQRLVAANDQFVPAAFRSGQLLGPSERASLAMLRRFNIAQPYLRNQVILAKVLRSAPRQLLVDPGYYGVNWVPRQELSSAMAHDAQGRPIQRQSAVVNPGEYVKVRLSFFETPYGDAQLDAVSTGQDVRQKLVWEQLVYRMNTGLPVQGRILNATAGGFAVAVAGYVALLPHGQAEAHQVARIGLLQEFTVHSVDHKKRFIRLSGTKSRSGAHMEELYRKTL